MYAFSLKKTTQKLAGKRNGITVISFGVFLNLCIMWWARLHLSSLHTGTMMTVDTVFSKPFSFLRKDKMHLR